MDDECDIYFDAEADDISSLWTPDISRRFDALKGKKDDVLDRVIDLIADVPTLRREVARLREEVSRLKAQTAPQQQAPQPTSPFLSPPPPFSSPPPPLLATKKKRRRKRKKKTHSPDVSTPPIPPPPASPVPLHHSTPAPPRQASSLTNQPRQKIPPPPPLPVPYTTVTHTNKPQRPLIPLTSKNVHFYHDSNNRYTTQHDIQTTINNINEMTSKPKQTYNITFHKTFTLQRTLTDIKTRDLKDSIIIIDTTTNNAKYDHNDNFSPHRTHNTLRNIILTLQNKHIDNKNIIILETIPSLKFDIHPYNLAAAATCKQMGVRFCANLVGEAHLWEKDGIHVAHPHRPLHVSSVAAAIVGVDPHQIFRIQRPPLGSYGPWRFPWGSQNRPVPTTRWPPPGMVSSCSDA